MWVSILFPSGTNKQSFSDCTSTTTNDTGTNGGRNNGSSSSNLCTTGTLKSQQELLQEQVNFLSRGSYTFGFCASQNVSSLLQKILIFYKLRCNMLYFFLVLLSKQYKDFIWYDNTYIIVWGYSIQSSNKYSASKLLTIINSSDYRYSNLLPFY